MTEKTKKYLEEKRLKVLKEIKPICEAFNITEYDYIITPTGGERLKLYSTEIGCASNSLSAIIDELVGWLFVDTFAKNRWLGHFETQTLNQIKKWWIEV